MSVALFAAVIISANPANAEQENTDRHSFLAAIAKGIVLDPTTYAPGVIAYDATMRDWNSSQPLFRRGFVEQNRRFTISGLPNDVPVGYEQGRHRILMDALGNVGQSAVNNAASRITERLLMKWQPDHRRAIRRIGWIQRTAIAAYTSYVLAAPHYRQWRANGRLVDQLGH